ncbi:MAG: hypothetical protein MUF05_02365 [Candidatus Omnitrophica bacterium]|jgi:TolA-binding protein|nr:hypothetical protein [Candidatus Omnitrophota bacterium]
MAKDGNKVLLGVLILVVLASIFFWKDYLGLKTALISTQKELAQEKQEKEALKTTLNSEIDKLSKDLDANRVQVDQLTAKLGDLESRHKESVKARKQIEDQYAQLQNQKQILEARLGSLSELKKAFREVKQDMRQKEIQQYLARKQKQKELDQKLLANGNRGFVIRDGKSSYNPKVYIDVKPGN